MIRTLLNQILGFVAEQAEDNKMYEFKVIKSLDEISPKEDNKYIIYFYIGEPQCLQKEKLSEVLQKTPLE